MQEFVKPEAADAINRDYPKVEKPGSFPLSETTFGPKFEQLIDDLNSPEFRAAFEAEIFRRSHRPAHDDHCARALLRGEGRKHPH